jgi:hypothetical protein
MMKKAVVALACWLAQSAPYAVAVPFDIVLKGFT